MLIFNLTHQNCENITKAVTESAQMLHLLSTVKIRRTHLTDKF